MQPIQPGWSQPIDELRIVNSRNPIRQGKQDQVNDNRNPYIAAQTRRPQQAQTLQRTLDPVGGIFEESIILQGKFVW